MSETGLYYNSTSNVVYDATPPVITLIGSANINIEINSGAYSDAGFTCEDAVNGDLSGDVVISGDTVDHTTLGVYTIYFDVVDASGNVAIQKTRVVNVIDTTNPVVTLTGDTDMDVVVNTTYTEQGATASDNSNESLTVVISGDTVDTSTIGDYTVLYTATDSSSNVHQIARLVHVITAPLALVWSNPSTNIFTYLDTYYKINSLPDETVSTYTVSGNNDSWLNGNYEVACSSYRGDVASTFLASVFGTTGYGGGNELYYESGRSGQSYNDSTLGNIGPRSALPYSGGVHISTTASGHTLYFSTVASGTTYYGEFIETTFPFRLKPTKFYMDGIMGQTNWIPKQMIICGSNDDGATYEYIATIGDSSTSPASYNNITITSPDSYKKIRVICTISSGRSTFFLQFYKIYGEIYS
jgi:hypothetical protein